MKNANISRLGGFTLIELLVVVLIIGILAGVALPQYEKAVAKSRYTQLITAGKTLKDAMETYYMANGDYPQFWSQLDVEFPGCTESRSGRYMLWCDKFAVDMFRGPNVNLVFYDTHGVANKGKGQDPYSWSPKFTSVYGIWLDHSDNPGKTACQSSISGLCKSLGLENENL